MYKPLQLTAIFVFLSLSVLHAQAQQNALEKHIPEAVKLGEARFKYLWIDVYDIELYSQKQPFHFGSSFALKIDYLRSFKAEKIAERSIKEIQQQSFENQDQHEQWLDEMQSIFPDVKKGDSITGVAASVSKTVFYHNNVLIGEIDDKDFRNQFFNIWLSENSSAPDLTKKLRGY